MWTRRGWGRGASSFVTVSALASGVACGGGGNDTSPQGDAAPDGTALGEGGDEGASGDAVAPGFDASDANLDGTMEADAAAHGDSASDGASHDGHAGQDASDAGDGSATDASVDSGLDAHPGDAGFAAGQWTWENGVPGQGNDPARVYDAGANDTPGGRMGAATWTQPGTTLWLFGGFVSTNPPTRPNGYLNDLWHYDSGKWTWVSGGALNQPGVYGSPGDAGAGNVPGARTGAITWVDGGGNVFLFGGQGYDSKGTFGMLDDVWQYASGQWTWVAGSNVVNQPGTYGVLGTPSASNFPGARTTPAAWVDAAGDFWLFGGTGCAAKAGVVDLLNDLWHFHAGQWTWVAGSNAVDQPATYGTLGTPSAGNTPGARDGATGWAGKSGAFWVFGGGGYTASSAGTGDLNDLWRWAGGQWTWMSGSNAIMQPGTYGTPGVPAAGNTPGARAGAAGWVGATGALWLFGGGEVATGALGSTNDLWKYEGGAWTWMAGPTTVNDPGVYLTPGTPSSSELPAARDTTMTWTDGAGAFWLYGGSYSAPGVVMGDMWKLVPN